MGQLRKDSAPWLETAPPLPPNGLGTGALEPGLPGTAVGNNRVSGEPEGSREQEAGNPSEALPTQATPRRGKNSIESCSSRSPAQLSATLPPRGNRGQRLVCPLGGSSRSRWPEASVCAAPPVAQLGDSGGRRAGSARNRPKRAAVCTQLQAARSQYPGCSPRRCSLPSDSAAQKANGKGASFKVHINPVLVGYSLAATTAVPKRMVLTTQGDPLLGASSAFSS